MYSMQPFFKRNISKGGLAGAILGSLISTQAHKPTESIGRKTIKTGLFAALGFALGALIEKRFTHPTDSSQKKV